MMAFQRGTKHQNESGAFLILSKLLELTYFIKTRRPNRVQTKINLIYSLHQMRFSKFPPGHQREVDSRFLGGKYLCYVVRYAMECPLSPLQRFRSLSSKLASGWNGNPLSN